MEPLMTLDGYRIIENERESRELLNKFYEQKESSTASLNETSIKASDASGSTHIQIGK